MIAATPACGLLRSESTCLSIGGNCHWDTFVSKCYGFGKVHLIVAFDRSDVLFVRVTGDSPTCDELDDIQGCELSGRGCVYDYIADSCTARGLCD